MPGRQISDAETHVGRQHTAFMKGAQIGEIVLPRFWILVNRGSTQAD
jgi:hypothetical protein